MTLPIADWQAALAEMETALGATLAALDRYQQRWGELLGESPAPGEPHDRLSKLEGRLREWDARLAAAAELAAAVERELKEREVGVSRWQELYDGWQGLIKQSGTPAALTS